MSWTNLREFTLLCDQHDIEVPEVATRGLELIGVAEDLYSAPKPRALDMDPAEVREHIYDVSIRGHKSDASRAGGLSRSDRLKYSGLGQGIAEFEQQIWEEVRAELMPHLDSIVEQLRPRFDETVAPIVKGAREHGFTFSTTSDDVIRSGNTDAVEVWREIGRAWGKVTPLARLRARISELFTVSPTPAESKAFGSTELLNWSVCFAAGEQWGMQGELHIEDRASIGGIDWFALAQGGLRLNTPSEVRAKLVARAQKNGKSLSDPRDVEARRALLDTAGMDELPTYSRPISF